MGCHTWYKLPYITGKEEIKKVAEKAIEKWTKDKDISESRKRMYQYAIDEELLDVVTEIAAMGVDEYTEDIEEWVIYSDPNRKAIDEINKIHGTEYTRLHQLLKEHEIQVETWHDGVRIGGYPNWVIKSYDQLLEKIETGYTDEDEQHYIFYYENNSKEAALEKVKRFFDKHPDGIITFG
jgi:hypothetical protein